MINYIEYLVGAVITSVVGAVGWLVRKVLTSETEIQLLKSEIKARDQRRDEDRQLLIDLKADLKSEMKETREDIESIRAELTDIWKKG